MSLIRFAVALPLFILTSSCQPPAAGTGQAMDGQAAAGDRGTSGDLDTAMNLDVNGGAVPVEVVLREGRYTLMRDGEPYSIRGAGIEFADIGNFAAQGGNSLRTWRTDSRFSTGQEVLDEAARHGVTVVLCIEIGRERLGFDYDDEHAVAEQFEFARGEVMKYKDHPALLAWMVGNEANLFFENPRVFDAINDIAGMIHEVDGLHPVTTALAGFNPELAGLIEQRAPDLDFVSIQMYGDIVHLPSIASNPRQIMGSYVFLWGQKQERTPTWYGQFLEDGVETEAWVRAADPDGDVLAYRWEIMRESEATQDGGDLEEVPERIEGRIDDPGLDRIRVTAPADPGAYRLFVYIYDGRGKAGHANIPFYVE